jgi:hypothetical protein
MIDVGIAQTDITPAESVWLNGYGNRDHKSEGVYQTLKAGAIYLRGNASEAVILTADHIGYGPAYAAEAKLNISQATGLLPHQIILTATHTHCAPFFTPWIMPGDIEAGYVTFLHRRLVEAAVAAKGNCVRAEVSFSRGTSTFGVNRRLPDGDGGILFAPNPDGPFDRDLDTLWFSNRDGKPLGSLTVYGCHPTSLGGYMIGGDYPGYLCRQLESETGAPAFFATGCAGDIRPWFNPGESDFARPTLDELAAASEIVASEVLRSQSDTRRVDSQALRADTVFHLLPYTELPDREAVEREVEETADPRRRTWARQVILPLLDRGALPSACPQEIQVLQLDPDLRLVFLGGEILTEIGLHIKQALEPATTVTVGYTNGLIGYVPGKETYPLGGYEVSSSYHLFLRPAPFTRDAEDLVVGKAIELTRSL